MSSRSNATEANSLTQVLPRDKCCINLKRGYSGCHEYGTVLDGLDECCPAFKSWFFSTGGFKTRNFNERTYEDNGFCLTTRGHKVLILRLFKTSFDGNFRQTFENELRYCPFCGTKVEFQVTKTVDLKQKFKQISDGYEEVVIHPKQT